MKHHNHHFVHMCHWCFNPYQSSKPEKGARFCCLACKQAHWRAYHKYVTAKAESCPDRKKDRRKK